MTRSKLHLVYAAAIALGLVVATAGDATAGWRWHGSSGGSSGGGSSGGWGSSGGSWGGSSGGWGGSSGGGSSGGWGSSGGGSSGGGGWFHKHKHRGWGSSGGGSSGGWGGSSGGWSHGSSGGGSSGGWSGGSSGGGSSGGAYYNGYAPAYEMAVPYEQGVPAGQALPPADGGALPPLNDGTSTQRADGLLTVEVPDDAKIYVNGQATSSKGDMRQYVSRDLQSGFNYSYEVKAEVVRDGKTIEQVRTIDLRAGQNAKLAFDFAPAASVETSLTVHVPENAKVFLAGNETAATGETRIFRTTSLTEGKAWDAYTIRVEFEQNGEKVVKEEKITLGAGEAKELRFDAAGDRVATAR